MPDNEIYHRRFLPFKPLEHDDKDYAFYRMMTVETGDVDTIRQSYDDNYENEHSLAAYSFTKDGLKPIRIVPKPDQDFEKFATPFEKGWSGLCGGGKYAKRATTREIERNLFLGKKRLEPVVDDSLSVVGHMGWVQNASIYVPNRDWIPRIDNLNKILVEEEGWVVVSAKSPNSSFFTPYTEHPETDYLIVTDPFGTVLLQLDRRSWEGLAPPAIDPYVLLGVGQLALAVGKGIGSYLVRRIVAKIAPMVAAKLAARKIAQILANKTGKKTAAEMEQFIETLIKQRPELQILRSASKLEGEALQREVLAALTKWERSTGKTFKVTKLGEVQRISNRPGNYASLQGDKLMIEEHVLTDSKAFYKEAVHELSADALGVRGGSINPDDLAFIGEVYYSFNSSLSMLEVALKDVEQFRRTIQSFY